MDHFKNITLYYFSGTGNTLAIAKWMAEEAEKRNINVELISIDRFKTIKHPHSDKNLIIGFLNPTHGFFVPWLMFRFMLKFPRIKKTSVFFANARGGMRIWKFHIPGLTGVAHLIPAIIFLCKGMKIKGAQPIDTPHNFISIAPPQNKLGQEKMFPRNKRSTVQFINKILDGKFAYHPKSWISLPLDIALIPVTLGYVIMARFLIGKLLYASYNCNNCNLCIDNCPVFAIKKVYNRPFWTTKCESCMRCMNICPNKSIQSWATRLIILYILLFIPFYHWSLNLIRKFPPFDNNKSNIITDNFFALISQFIIVPFYFIFCWLLSFVIINKMITFTSLSAIWGRFINRFVKVKELLIQNK